MQGLSYLFDANVQGLQLLNIVFPIPFGAKHRSGSQPFGLYCLRFFPTRAGCRSESISRLSGVATCKGGCKRLRLVCPVEGSSCCLSFESRAALRADSSTGFGVAPQHEACKRPGLLACYPFTLAALCVGATSKKGP